MSSAAQLKITPAPLQIPRSNNKRIVALNSRLVALNIHEQVKPRRGIRYDFARERLGELSRRHRGSSMFV